MHSPSPAAPSIVGVGGFRGAGKTTVAKAAGQLGYTSIAFADPIKDALECIFGFDRDMLRGESPEARRQRESPDPFWTDALGYPLTPRKAMQMLGTDAGRNVFGQNLWVAATMRRCMHHTHVIIPDIRFQNELLAVKEQGGITLFVRRPEEEPEWVARVLQVVDECRRQRILPEIIDLRVRETITCEFPDHEIHASDLDILMCVHQFDHVVMNTGTAQDLAHQVQDLLESPSSPPAKSR